MICNYVYNPNIWPPVLMALLMATLSVYSGRRRSVPGATALMIASLFAAAWAAGSLLEYAAVDVATRTIWFKVQAAVQIPIAIAITCFILEYAWPGRWLTRRNLALLALPGLLGVVMLLTDDLHHLAWRSFSLANGSIKPQFGPGSWALLVYSFGMLGLVNLLVFGWLFRRSPQHRWPVVLMLVGQLAGRMIFLLDRASLVQSPLPLDLFGMSLEFLMYAIVLLGFRILDPLPLARQTLVTQLREGMLVLDSHGRVTSLNPAAQAILGQPSRRLLGQSIQDLLPTYAAEIGSLQAAGTGLAEINLKTGPESRAYQVELSSLNDFRGQVVGRLLLLRDVTDQKRAQAQIIEQQRALAMLHEREQLARELHDSLGQVLGYASFQVDAAAKLSRDGQGAAAADQLDRLGSVIREAHADVREYILNLHTAPSTQQPFFTILEQYLKGFTNNYGIQTHLAIDPGLGDQTFSPDAQLQVFRILQEALSNARKHGHAHQVQVTIMPDDGRVCLSVQDDGSGFAPNEIGSAGGQHFALRFMQERAEQLGGSLQVQSAPGAGTRVILQVPVNSKPGRRDESPSGR